MLHLSGGCTIKDQVHRNNPPSPDLVLDHQLYYPWGSFAVSVQGRVAYPEMAPVPDGPFSINPVDADSDLPHPPLDIVLVAPHEDEAARERMQHVEGRWKMLITAQELGDGEFQRLFPGVRDPDADIVHGMCYGLASGLGHALVQLSEEQQFNHLKSQQRILTTGSYTSTGALLVGDLIPDMTVSPYMLGGAAMIIGAFEVLRRRQLNRDVERITTTRPKVEEVRRHCRHHGARKLPRSGSTRDNRRRTVRNGLAYFCPSSMLCCADSLNSPTNGT